MTKAFLSVFANRYFSVLKDTLASEKVNFRCHDPNKRGLPFYWTGTEVSFSVSGNPMTSSLIT